MWLQYTRLHRLVVKVVRADEVCRRFMAIPGVGPVVALQVKTALDDPGRFSRSKTVGAYFGLTSRRWQTGTSVDIQGRISKMGDDDVRRALVEAATACCCATRVGQRSRSGASRSAGRAAVNARWWRSRASLRSSCLRCGATARSIASERRKVLPKCRNRRSKRASSRHD